MPIASLLIDQQRSDKSPLFRQEVFRAKIACVAPGAFFIAVYRQYGSANRECAGRFRACCPHVTEYYQRILLFPQAQSRQAKRCPSCPVPRFLSDKNLSFPLRRFSCAVRRSKQQSQISVFILCCGVIGPKLDNLCC